MCPITQRYNSKATHNTGGAGAATFNDVPNNSKIQFKSNSQLGLHGVFPVFDVPNNSKIQFKSNSQLMEQNHPSLY